MYREREREREGLKLKKKKKLWKMKIILYNRLTEDMIVQLHGMEEIMLSTYWKFNHVPF